MHIRIDELKTEILKYKNVIIYGAGNNAGPVLSWLNENQEFCNIQKHVAVTIPKAEEFFKGIKVEKIDDLVGIKSDSYVVVAVFEAYFKDIDNKLDQLGFKNRIHIGGWFVEEAYYEEFYKEPIDNKKILVENFHGLGYGDSPKYIVDELLKRRDDLDIVWIVRSDKNVNVPIGVRTVEIYTRQFFYEVATSKVWISNVRKYQSVRKRAGQYYIQTWHGFTLKRIEKDAEKGSNGISAPYFDAGKKDSKMIDLLISNAQFLTNVFRKGFWYKGPILECGTPRNDIFFNQNQEILDKIHKEYKIAKNKKILLYAPTFRNSYVDNPFDIELEQVLVSIERKTKSEWVALVRMHPNITGKSKLFLYSNRIIDATEYSDVMELLYTTDALITDYSSIMFDFLIKKKPIFLYSKDLERYTNDDRGFYFDYSTLPFPIAKSNEQLLSVIDNFDEKSYIKNIEDFSERVGFCDNGSASQIITDIIMKKIT